MEMKTLPSCEEVLERIDAFHNLEKTGIVPGGLNGGSERMARLMRRLGSPHAVIPAVHVAGTKGKGSVAGLVAAALTAAGLKTGIYTSPHVEDVRERIQIDGRPVGRECFAAAGMAVLPEAEAMRGEGACPSWFEVFTAVAFVVFRSARVETMVLETGLGGRLDATNLPDLRLAACGITTIAKDHENVLGSNLAAIAAEKAAIIKPRIPVVVMPQEDGVMRVVAARAEEASSRIFKVGKDIRVNVAKPVQPDRPGLGQRLDFETWRCAYRDLPIAMLGRHQAENAGIALGLVDLFLEYMDREPIDPLALKRAWRSLRLPARMEVMSERPWLVVDGAHNPASAWAAAETLTEAFSTARRTLIFGVANDKNYRAMLRILAPLFNQVILTAFDSPRAVPAGELERFLRKEFPGARVSAVATPADALEKAESLAPEDGLILATGSLWLAGELRALCRREKAAQA